MKKLIYLVLTVSLFSFMGCDDDTVTKTVRYKTNEPVFMEANEFRSSVKITDVPQPISERGKMCFYDGFLYISEPEKGFHIIDNRNPSNPKSVGFVELIGNVDLGIRQNVLYADSYVDLVWFDITDPAKPSLKGRLENVFPHALPCFENDYGYDYQMCETGTGIVVGWKEADRSYTYTYNKGDMLDASPESSNSGSGKNGSMSRFSMYSDYLYVVLNDYMHIFNITGETPVEAASKVQIGWNVETIFSYKDCMFMGTPWGMHIYSVENPLAPERMSSITHVFGCDPVVVEDDLAYVTIHSGNMCGQNSNQLLIVDVSDVRSPKQLVTYSMTKPKGLGIDNGTLFICDDGLKAYKIGEPQKLMSNKLAHYTGMEGYDVIPINNVLMMVADDGLYQYDYSNPEDIKFMSKLAIGQ